MFREALDYATRPPEGGRAVLLGGGVLILVAVFIGSTGLGLPYGAVAAFGLIPWLLVRGYYVRVIRTTIGRERPTPPRFGNVRRLLIDGVAAVSISIAYLLPGAVILGPLLAIQILGTDLSTLLVDRAVPELAINVIIPIVGLLAVAALMYVLAALYVLPVAVAQFAHTTQLRTAFDVRTVISGAVSEDYAIAWGFSFVLQAVVLPIAFLFRIFLVGFFLEFIVAVGVRYCYGRGVGAALDLEPVAAAHERSDPETWELRSAITRVDRSGDDESAVVGPSDTNTLRPAITRIEDARFEWSDR